MSLENPLLWRWDRVWLEPKSCLGFSQASGKQTCYSTQRLIQYRALKPLIMPAPTPTPTPYEKCVWCRGIDEWCTWRLGMMAKQHLLGQLLSRLVVMCVTAGLVVSQRCLVPCPQAPALSAWCQGPPHQSRCKLRLLPKVSLSVPPCTSVCTLKTVQLMLCTVASKHGTIVTAAKRGFKVFDPGWGQCVRKTYLNKHHHWSPLAPLLSVAVPNLTFWTLHSCVLLMRACPSSLGQQWGGGGWDQLL